MMLSVLARSQGLVQYSSEFKFKDGIYLSFQDFKNNNPVSATHILSNLDIRSSDFIESVLESDTLIYYDGLYEERTTSVKNIWGFANGGKVYIGFKDTQDTEHETEAEWYPLMFIGAYSYFTAIATVSYVIPPNPGMMMQSRGTILDDGYMYPDDGSTYNEKVTVHQLLDFKTGDVFKIASGDLSAIHQNLMQELLQNDHAILEQYQALSRRDQKQKSMYYIRRYNERNPIHFP